MALEHASRVRRDGRTIECGTYTNVQAGEAGREGDGGRGKGRRCALGFKLGAVRWLDGLRAFLLDVNKRALVKVVLVLCLLVLGYRVVVGGEILVVGLVVRGLVLARGVHDRVHLRARPRLTRPNPALAADAQSTPHDRHSAVVGHEHRGGAEDARDDAGEVSLRGVTKVVTKKVHRSSRS